MEYSKIVSVSGLPGLFELISSKADGAIVRSLDDKSTRFASSRIHNFSHLESIEVYTVQQNVNLVDVFHAMEKSGGSIPDTKDNVLVKKYFEKVYPDMDFERVYNSDLKKMLKWFEVLKKNDIEIKISEPEEEVAEPEIEEKEEQPETPKKETAKSKTNKEKKSPDKKTKEKSSTKDKPAKKAAKKKGK